MASRLTKLLIKGAKADSNTIADVPCTIQAVSGQTGDLLQVLDASGTVLWKINAGGVVTVNTVGLEQQLRVAHVRFDFAVDGGVTGLITPAKTVTIPINALMLGGSFNVIDGVLSAGSATLAFGTSAGSSASALLAATAKASLGTGVKLNAVPVFATPVKMSAAGVVTCTVGAADLTAGIVEGFILYVVPSA